MLIRLVFRRNPTKLKFFSRQVCALLIASIYQIAVSSVTSAAESVLVRTKSGGHGALRTFYSTVRIDRYILGRDVVFVLGSIGRPYAVVGKFLPTNREGVAFLPK